MKESSHCKTGLPKGFEFHHIGYATKSISRELELFKYLGYRQEGEEFYDNTQGVIGCFISGTGPRIELLQNIEGSGTLDDWLKCGIKMYHFAYLVSDIEEAIRWVERQRARVIVKPVPSVAFKGQRICFAIFRHGQMIEIINK